VKEKLNNKTEEVKRLLGWKFYLLLIASYGLAGYLFEIIAPTVKEFVFGLGFQPLIKTAIYYVGLGYIISILVPITMVIVAFIYISLKR